MSPYRAIFLVYPVAVVFLTIFLKVLFKKRKSTNLIILTTTYVLTNIAIYMLVEGVFSNNPYRLPVKIEDLFTDLNVRQWIDLLLVPNVFTFMYIGICQLFIWLIDKEWWKNKISINQQVFAKRGADR